MLAGMDLSLWPRVRKLFVDWGYRGLKETASSLGLELEVVARPYAGVRGVWVPEGAEVPEVPEIPRESGFKPLPKRWVVERTRGGWWRGPLPGWGGTGVLPRTMRRTLG